MGAIQDSAGTTLVVPDIRNDESFGEIARKLSLYVGFAISFTSPQYFCCIIEAVQSPLTWDDLRSTKHIKTLQPIIDHLSTSVHHPALVAALLALKGHFVAIESDDDCGINSSRGLACELIAWQFVLRLSERDTLDYLLFELLSDGKYAPPDEDEEAACGSNSRGRNGAVHKGKSGSSPHERTALLHEQTHASGSAAQSRASSATFTEYRQVCNYGEPCAFSEPFLDLNTLEIAAVSSAKKFLSQRCVQDLVDAIWRGDVVFWDALTAKTVKKPHFYRRDQTQDRRLLLNMTDGPPGADPWTRLRVPRYMKAFEMVFFLTLLALFYAVSLQRVEKYVTGWEVVLYVFIAGYAAEQWGQFVENGAQFFSTDIWSLWDIGIICIGTTFFVLRMVGLGTGDELVKGEVAFGALALMSLFLTPRIFSLLSLNKYYGSLLPCLKEMGKQFVRFLGFVLIIYVGFFSTFYLLARGHFPLDKLSITTLKVFFGAGVVGFDVASQISPYLGLPVMVIFVCLTNQLLITSMMAHISNSLRQVLDSSREEYLYVYSVYVLEASTSNKLTYFFMPLNLVPILAHPFLIFASEQSARKARIFLLKLTHAPIMISIWAFERWEDYVRAKRAAELDSMRFWTMEGSHKRQGRSIGGKSPSNTRVAKLGRQPQKSSGWQVPSDLMALSRNPTREVQMLAGASSQLARAQPLGPATEGDGAKNRNAAKKKAEQQEGKPDRSNDNEMEMMRMLKDLAVEVQELRAELRAQKKKKN
ncbi:uncharacterized protein JN550_012087 [Neoarthrinium moseri]|uniref:uncharacterized protein n=1 Tax=Neoarthrinium moseri TaxID=1658444 RepID=UPI001FDCC20A|nr:uncharacterized protein JN550_012087 [Neoarthrinium moseri]KAI1859278.1 hypothetical protein JN550_012087 [Neoarthrinium moseri]